MKNNDLDDDFGFSAISAIDYEARIARAEADASDEYIEKLQKLENMFLPFLEKLRDTGEKEYIFWPNRKPAIDKQIAKMLEITRGK